MIQINNFITKCLHTDNDNIFKILCILDFDKIWNKEEILQYLTIITNQNLILKNYIEKKDNNYYWIKGNDFNIDNFYTIQCEDSKNFDKATNKILNYVFLSKYKWHFYILNDNNNNKSRIYVKIDHTYCDGYSLIDILIKPLYSNYKKIEFKRKNTTMLNYLYYVIIGTILLIIINLKIILKLFFKKNNINNSINSLTKKTKHIYCGSIQLQTIKNITSKYKITVNTFLYTLMIKTWYNYNKTNNNTLSISPININNNTNDIYNGNNIFIILSEVENINDNITLFKKIDELFNLYKFSPFIPITNTLLCKLLPYLSQNFQSTLCNKLFYNINLTFSNMICPYIDKNNTYNLNNVQFSTNPKNNEICFNMLSFNNTININVSSRDNIIKQKKRFIKCFKNAYNNLITLH